jgi:hypothetical protein
MLSMGQINSKRDFQDLLSETIVFSNFFYFQSRAYAFRFLLRYTQNIDRLQRKKKLTYGTSRVDLKEIREGASR